MIKNFKTKHGDVPVEIINTKFRETPKTTYKFRIWSNQNHQKILSKQELWIPSPSTFNDPFDCRINVAYHLMAKDEKLAREFFTRLVSKNPKSFPPEQKEQYIEQALKDAHFKDDEWLDDHNETTIKQSHEILGVYCLSPTYNNAMMWSHYADGHRGFCVGFDMEKLCPYFSGGGFVTYSDKYPIISPIEEEDKKYFMPLVLKSDHWDYEVEYRLLKMGVVNQAIPIDKSIIKEVVLGCLMEKEHKKEIIELVSSQLPHVKILQAKKQRDTFDITFS